MEARRGFAIQLPRQHKVIVPLLCHEHHGANTGQSGKVQTLVFCFRCCSIQPHSWKQSNKWKPWTLLFAQCYVTYKWGFAVRQFHTSYNPICAFTVKYTGHYCQMATAQMFPPQMQHHDITDCDATKCGAAHPTSHLQRRTGHGKSTLFKPFQQCWGTPLSVFSTPSCLTAWMSDKTWREPTQAGGSNGSTGAEQTATNVQCLV